MIKHRLGDSGGWELDLDIEGEQIFRRGDAG